MQKKSKTDLSDDEDEDELNSSKFSSSTIDFTYFQNALGAKMLDNSSGKIGGEDYMVKIDEP